jgi:lipid A 3-O-deacylase
MRFTTLLFTMITLICWSGSLFAEDFYLDSPYNSAILRYEIDNDAVWDRDSGFSNGWSLQYHTPSYDSWDNTQQFGFIKWIGNHFPTLGDEGSIVRSSHSIGQNMVTPGDIGAEYPPPGDLPYAGTLTYSLTWQRFNRKTASIFQISLGVLGEAALAGQTQIFVHDSIDATDPQGWDTQRDSEPILNIGYKYSFALVDIGQATDSWSGRFEMSPAASVGNLVTAADLGLIFRIGWNRLEGFTGTPAPPGRGFFQAAYIPKPKNASPHSIELVAGVRGTALLYSVLYDGSFLTSDERDVGREDCYLAVGSGLIYHYHKLFSVSVFFQGSTDIIKEESLPQPATSDDDTTAKDADFGALIIDYYF